MIMEQLTFIFLSFAAAAVAIVLISLTILSFVIKPGAARVPIRSRHVFVTGGSMGIGLSIAKQAAAEGARVSILARNRKKLEEAREEIKRETGADVAVYSVDVRDEDGVRKALDDAGTVDVLVCNQGFFLPRELTLMDMEEVKYTLDVNLLGTFNLIRHALPAMQQNGNGDGGGAPSRSITIVSSQVGQIGLYGYTHYCASKFALRGLAEALQLEVIPHNIRVCLVFPPGVDTPGTLDRIDKFPELTTILGSASTRMSADEVARETLEGIKSGQFFVPCNWQGFALSLASSGGSPATSSAISLCEIALAGVIRLGLIVTVNGWYRTIAKWNAEKKKRDRALM